MRAFIKRLLAIGCVVGLLGCGVIHDGSTTADAQPPNDPIMATGSFIGVNSQSVTGVATVYYVSVGNYITFLDSISAPSGDLQVITVNNGTQVNTQTLQSSSGSTSYSFSASVTGSFNQVLIFSPSANENYGIATLQQQN